MISEFLVYTQVLIAIPQTALQGNMNLVLKPVHSDKKKTQVQAGRQH